MIWQFPNFDLANLELVISRYDTLDRVARHSIRAKLVARCADRLRRMLDVKVVPVALQLIGAFNSRYARRDVAELWTTKDQVTGSEL